MAVAAHWGNHSLPVAGPQCTKAASQSIAAKLSHWHWTNIYLLQVDWYWANVDLTNFAFWATNGEASPSARRQARSTLLQTLPNPTSTSAFASNNAHFSGDTRSCVTTLPLPTHTMSIYKLTDYKRDWWTTPETPPAGAWPELRPGKVRGNPSPFPPPNQISCNSRTMLDRYHHNFLWWYRYTTLLLVHAT